MKQAIRAFFLGIICIFSLQSVFGQSKVNLSQVHLHQGKIVTFSARVYGLKVSKNRREIVLSVGNDSTKSHINVFLKQNDNFSESDFIPGLVFDITGKVTVNDKSGIVVIADKLPKLRADYFDDTTKLPVFN